jgi:hypothetical protein
MPTMRVPIAGAPQPMQRIVVSSGNGGDGGGLVTGCTYGAGLDRMSVWLLGMRPSPDASGVAKPPVPPQIEFEIKASLACAAGRIGLCTYFPSSWDESGLLFQIAGLLTEAFELWIRVIAGVNAIDTYLDLGVLVDRQGGAMPIASAIMILGNNVA